MSAAEYAAVYALLEDVTPLEEDCGRLCGHRCCQSPEDEAVCGMRLFPGEMGAQKRRELERTEGFSFPNRNLLVCGGRCRRELRPLSCRIFPLFPYLEETGQIRAVYDPRAWRICPLVRYHDRVRLRSAFVRRVRKIGRMLAADPACREFLREQSREIDDINRFLRLEAVRPPICRRKPDIL